MAKEIVKIKNLRLAHTREGMITIKHVERPYGEHSNPLVSISISEHGEKIDSYMEIPYENLEDVVKALGKSLEVCKSIHHEHFHDELLSDVGGGQ